MSTDLQTFAASYNTVKDMLASPNMQDQLRAALPKHVSPERLARLVLTELRRIPRLLDCTRESLLGSVMEAAQLGLDIGTRGHAWILPYKVKGIMTAQLIVGYRGMLDLAWRSGQLRSVYAHVVRDGDVFEYEYGTAQFLRHQPSTLSLKGEISHAYSGCTTVNGGEIFDVMSIEEIESARKRSRAKDSGPWVTDYAEMCRKTSLRRMLKIAPCGLELARAITLDEQAELGLEQRLEDSVVVIAPGSSEGVEGGPRDGYEEESEDPQQEEPQAPDREGL